MKKNSTVSSVVFSVRRDLQHAADEKAKVSAQRFFKEAIHVYGVKTGVVVGIAKKYWKEIGHWPKQMIFD